MSVYRDTEPTVIFEHPHAGPLIATVRRNGVIVKGPVTVEKTESQFRLPLTWVDTEFDGKLDITWSDADDFERSQHIEVATPLVSLPRLRTLFEGENKTDEQLAELEQTVRVFIQAYTGQSFGYFKGARTFVGNGSNRIALDMRLGKITGFTGGWVDYVKITDGGWALAVNTDNYLTVKMAPPEEFITSGGPIRVPSYYIKHFNIGATYTVTGEWGYDVVPDEVQEAAMLLANDFSCSEVIYRDRYLESIKIQQDTLTYHPGAFRGTGNARADLLLGKYRRSGMVII